MRTPTVSLLCLTGLLAFAAGWSSGDQPDGHDHHAAAFEQCAKACNDCQHACDSCATHCQHLLAQGKKEHVTTLRTCQDCAEHCGAAARITARQGPFADLICTACTEACARCGKACEKYPDDAHMKKCAEECRKCEKACREMLTHTRGIDKRTQPK